MSEPRLRNRSWAGRRFSLTLLTVFSVAALTLATLGIYGLISYLVAARTREIGIRLALGAESTDVPESPKQAVKSAWTAALEGRLPERAADLREAIQSRAAKAPLTSLQKLVDALRAREASDQAQATEWRALRGSVHQALAVRGSRVALYDLKESLSQTRTPLPVSFLSAVVCYREYLHIGVGVLPLMLAEPLSP